MTEFTRMWKFVRGKSQQSSVERQKLQKELFSFRKTVQHGFPNKPTALAWDPTLRIAAIGTASGAIKVFGKCGVEFYGHHSTSDHGILRLLFIPNEGRIITLSDQNSLFLWDINDVSIEEIKFLVMEGKLKRISSLYIEESNKNLLVGTEGGNIYFVDINNFTLLEYIIYQDVVMQNVPEGYKVNPGAVEFIAGQPGNPENILIGYSRGLMVLWNKKDSEAVQTYVNNQQLESFCWDPMGKKFISSHNDGSYIFWNTESKEPVEEPITVYGPYPCKAITKIISSKTSSDADEDLIIFSGGMPRSNYSDRHTITIKQGKSKHVVLDFTSKVIDFFAIYGVESKGCESLIILLEEELVAIDLTSDDWKSIPLPYLISLHASAITFLTYVADISETIWDEILAVSEKQLQGTYSKLEWPINGGTIKETNTLSDENIHRDILLTGHEDGSVRLWNAGTTVLSLLYTFKSNVIFSEEDEQFDDVENHTEEEEDEWPPFRKVGCFDPYSDDPRLSIKKISFCGSTGILLIAGAAGQVITCKLNQEAVTNKQIKVTTINMIPEKNNSDEVTYMWKGPQRLNLKGKTEKEKDKITLSFPAGYQPSCIVQILPPAAVTALALQSEWRLIAFGTAHGLALYDYKTEMPILYKCTLNSNDYSTLSEPPISRTKSFKKSLRESFRRIRKGRSSGRHHDKQRSGSKSSLSPVSPPSATDRKRGGNETASSSSPITPNSTETKPIERAIEARPTDDALGSMVRCVYFIRTTVINAQHTIPSLWAGTNNGTVYIFTINVPGGSKRKNEKVTSQLGKEIQLKHRAPVISISVINMVNKLFQVDENDNSGPHSVIIGSEEQFKVFSLPNLKPTCKLKLTAMEGARVRRIALGLFCATNHIETCLLSLTNLGECIVLSIPDLRRQVTAAVIKREDINGISSFTFTKYGEGLYLHSSSEIQRITLSASRRTLPQCSLMLANSKYSQTPNSVTQEKQRYWIRSNITNGIPEEDEEEEEETDENNISKKESNDMIKKNVADEENQMVLNHDISAITVDSVKDHINGS